MKIWLSDEELKQFNEKYKNSKFHNKGAFIRNLIFKGMIIKVDTSDINAVAFEIGKIGTNINQIAKKANITGTVNQQEISDLKDDLNRIQESLIYLIRKFTDTFIK